MSVLDGARWDVREGDCLELLRGLPDGCVDCIVTDPPYGIGWRRGTWVDDPDAYPDMMREFVAQANRVTAGGPVFVWQAMRNCDRWHEWLPPGFRLFAACKGFVQYRSTAVQWSWDPVVFWGSWKGVPSFDRRDWCIGSPTLGDGNNHPSPRPLTHATYIVNCASLPGQTVLDPFCGSGTTGVAAVQLGRRFLGMELSGEYCAMARQRIGQAQPPLLVEATP